MAALPYSVPGVYRRPAPRVPALPRVRTDVVGFVGVAGAANLHQAVKLDDWRSYEETYLRDDRGNAIAAPDGARLADCVRAYFTNGGSRCWVVNVAESIEASQSGLLLADMLGQPRPSGAPQLPVVRTGLELLALTDEVSVAVLPELDATVPSAQSRSPGALPPVFDEGMFFCCKDGAFGPIPDEQLPPDATDEARLFTDAEVQEAQRYLIDRIGREQWRLFVLLAPPPGLGLVEVLRWRQAIAPAPAGTSDPNPNYAAAAFYWPWLLVQPVPGDDVVAQSPLGFAAGVFARRDLAEGPFAAPANETLLGVVGTQIAVDDSLNGDAYDAGVNVIRTFPGFGQQLWGARTLLCTDHDSVASRPLAFVNIRRGLSAVERSVERIGQPAVFEPNLPLLRAQVAQAVSAYLDTVFRSGALQGATPDQAYFVVCDSSNNPPASVRAGQLLCEVGVAIAAPAEFIVFRVGRADGVVEIQEVA